MANGIELATAYVSIVTESSKIAPEVKKSFGVVGQEAEKTGKSSGGRFGKAFGGAAKGLIGAAVGLVAVSKVKDFLGDSIAEAREAQKVGAQTAAVIKSTGGAARLSAKQFGNLATSISLKTGIDDEQIQAGENMLATFTNIRDGLGKNNKIFSQATKLSTDLAVATGQSQVSANVLLGKALNDPAKGLGRLTKIGVTFTDQQKKQVDQMTKVGDVAGAQRVILKELAKEFGGSAEAQATAGEKAAVAFGNLKEQVGTALLPVLDRFEGFATKKLIPAVSEFVTQLQDGTGAGGDVRDAIEDVVKTGKGLVKFIDSVPGPIKKFGGETALAALAIGKLSGGMSTATTRVGKLTAASRIAAGAGGMILLANSTKEANDGFSALEAAAGGALSGAALGSFAGPAGAAIGAGIGAIGGATFSLLTHTQKSAEVVKDIVPKYQSYKDTLDQTTTALTGLTKQRIRDNLIASDGNKYAAALGLSTNTVINAVYGNETALKKVNAAIKVAKTNYGGLVTGGLDPASDAAFKLQGILGDQNDLLAKGKQDLTNRLLDLGKIGKLLPNIKNPKLKAEISGTPLDALQGKIVDFTRRYKLKPAQIQALLSLDGVPAAQSEIRSIIAEAKTKPAVITPKVNSGPAKSQLSTLLAPRTLTVTPKIGSFLGLSIPGRANGGPVQAGRPFVVGENRPELFIPNQNGRIQPRISQAASESISADGQRVAMTITNWQQGTGYIALIADSRVDAAAGMRGADERAFGG